MSGTLDVSQSLPMQPTCHLVDELFHEQSLSFWRKRWKQGRPGDFAAPVALVTAPSGEVPNGGSLLMLAPSFSSSLSMGWALI